MWKNTSVIKTLLITLSLFNNYSLIIIAHSTLTAGHRNNKNGSSRSYSNNNIPHQFSNAICHQLHLLQFVLLLYCSGEYIRNWVEHVKYFARTLPQWENSSSKLNVMYFLFLLIFSMKIVLLVSFWCFMVHFQID